ncbi:hypothetical protein [Streptomyces sp. NPDC003635]
MKIDIEALLQDPDAQDVERLAMQADVLVPALLQSVAGTKSTRQLEPVIRVLKRIGPPAFDLVVAAWRREEIPEWQAGRFLEVFDERSAEQYTALAADPSRRVRGKGFAGLVRLRVDSEAGFRALVETYAQGSPLPYKAPEYARLFGDSFASRLRTLRRDPAESPTIRRGAMAALAATGGADALDERDRAVLDRLIRTKIPHETPRLPSLSMCGWWIAVPGATYENLFEALGLHDRRPITVQGGIHATQVDERVRVEGPDGTFHSVGRAFVTPELDGWRLLYGPLDLLVGEPWEGMIEGIEKVSAHCGEAHFFYLDEAGGSDIWIVAKDGRVVRRYTAYDDPAWEGDPLPWETLAADDPDYEPEFEDDSPNAGTTTAETACGHLSVDPAQVGPDTRVTGHGWLALTARGAGHGAFRGVLRI